MSFIKEHFAISDRSTICSSSIDKKRVLKAAGNNAKYIGYFAKYDYITHRAAFSSGVVVCIQRDIRKIKEYKPIPKRKYGEGISYMSSYICSSTGLGFTKKELQTLIDVMGDGDRLVILPSTTTFDRHYFKTIRQKMR